MELATACLLACSECCSAHAGVAATDQTVASPSHVPAGTLWLICLPLKRRWQNLHHSPAQPPPTTTTLGGAGPPLTGVACLGLATAEMSLHVLRCCLLGSLPKQSTRRWVIGASIAFAIMRLLLAPVTPATRMSPIMVIVPAGIRQRQTSGQPRTAPQHHQHVHASGIVRKSAPAWGCQDNEINDKTTSSDHPH